MNKWVRHEAELEILSPKMKCMLFALLFESGSNLRQGNLLKNLTFAHVKFNESACGVVEVACTKLVGISASQACLNDVRVSLYLTDKLSNNILKSWNDCARSKGASDESFLFPHFLGDQDMDFNKPLDPKVHNQVIKDCAKDLGKGTSPDELEGYTSTCLRRGAAANTHAILEDIRAQLNQYNGWTPWSQVPDRHYVPKGVVMQPRPLMWAPNDINQLFDIKMHDIFVRRFSKMLCSICGFPNCNCKGCSRMIESSSKNSASTHFKEPIIHACWVEPRAGRKPASDPCPCQESRKQAWQHVDCHLALEYANGHYKFI